MSLKKSQSSFFAVLSFAAAVCLSFVLGMTAPVFGQQDDTKRVRLRPTQPVPVKPRPKAAKDKAAEKAAEKKPLLRTYVGFALDEVDDAVREYLDLPYGFGVLVAHVVEGSPAQQAGVKEKDIIMSFDGQKLTTPQHLQVLAATYSKGDKVELEVLRKGATEKLQITLGEAQLPPLATVEDDADPSSVMTFTPKDSATPTAVQVLPRANGDFLYVTPRADPAAVQKQVKEYREKMSEWMKQPAATRGPAPTLKLNVNPGKSEVRVHRVKKVENGEVKAEEAETKVETHTESSTSHSSGGASIRVGGDSAGIRVNGGNSIVIGPGASIRTTGTNGGQVKIANAHGSVVVKQENGKSVIEISDADGKSIHKGPWQPGKEMTDGLPPKAQAVLKKMNLQQLELLNIHVGPSGAKPPKAKDDAKGKAKDHKDADAGAKADKKPGAAAAADYRGSAIEKAD